MSDIATQLPIKITDGSNTVSISGSSLNVTGTVAGTGTFTTAPTGTQTVAGTVTAVPTGTQAISGTVTLFPTGTQTVAGTVTTVSGEESSGVITSYGTQASITNNSTGTVSYTVTSGKTLYLKQTVASSSGGPCKVIVDYDYSSSTTLVAVGFYSTAFPTLSLEYKQPPLIPATAVMNVKIENLAGATQDVYATIMGVEL